MQKRQGLDVGKCMLFFGARYKQASFWDQPESVGGTTVGCACKMKTFHS